jgi:hypothetical protein
MAVAGMMSAAAKVERSHCVARGQQEGSAPSRGSEGFEQNPLTAVLLLQPQPKAARMAKTGGATTTLTSGHSPRSVRWTAHIRKMGRPACTACAGPNQTC